ncbi:MAG: NYN domain-containing protein [Polyangiaceae bacterium]
MADDEPLIAVFIDYENLAIGVRDMGKGRSGVDLDVGLVLNRLLEKGRIVYKRAYCDWSHYRKSTGSLHQHGVIMIDIPQTGVSGKNSADIHMVVDAMDLCFGKDFISTFALLSGDSDFSPLVQKLKENNKRVIGCGVKSSTSGLLVKSCDEFIYYDDLVKRQERKPKRTRRKTAKKTPEDKKTEAVDQVMEIVRSLADDYENVWGSMVKQTLGRVNPGFNHEYHGYKSFNELLRDIEKRGLLELWHDESRGNYRVRLQDD